MSVADGHLKGWADGMGQVLGVVWDAANKGELV